MRGSHEPLRNSWHSPGSWVSCPKRQKHLIIQHLSNEGVVTPVAPACTPKHQETIVDFPGPWRRFTSQLWASQG